MQEQQSNPLEGHLGGPDYGGGGGHDEETLSFQPSSLRFEMKTRVEDERKDVWKCRNKPERSIRRLWTHDGSSISTVRSLSPRKKE